jgi:hypothetical protein
LENGAHLYRQDGHPGITFMPLMNIALLRAIVVLAAAALTACAQSTATDGSVAEAPPPAVRAPAPAARGTYMPPPPPPAPPPTQTAMTLERARGECWMKLEQDRRGPRDLDRRLKLVETCVADKMGAATREQ